MPGRSKNRQSHCINKETLSKRKHCMHLSQCFLLSTTIVNMVCKAYFLLHKTIESLQSILSIVYNVHKVKIIPALTRRIQLNEKDISRNRYAE